mmetsp:Transcript_4611/g.7968  ORF Transcript_4611/g.7968 Transcript_4611/m.7968 type:complete len:249 (+) Transcript_4611:299-1045(+)
MLPTQAWTMWVTFSLSALTCPMAPAVPICMSYRCCIRSSTCSMRVSNSSRSLDTLSSAVSTRDTVYFRTSVLSSRDSARALLRDSIDLLSVADSPALDSRLCRMLLTCVSWWLIRVLTCCSKPCRSDIFLAISTRKFSSIWCCALAPSRRRFIAATSWYCSSTDTFTSLSFWSKTCARFMVGAMSSTAWSLNRPSMAAVSVIMTCTAASFRPSSDLSLHTSDMRDTSGIIGASSSMTGLANNDETLPR